jgi:hypothetical protein
VPMRSEASGPTVPPIRQNGRASVPSINMGGFDEAKELSGLGVHVGPPRSLMTCEADNAGPQAWLHATGDVCVPGHSSWV